MSLISAENNFDSLISKGNVLVDFYADWCGPCKMLSLEIDDLLETIDVVKINVDSNSELCKKYGIMSIPTLIYFKEDGSYDKKVGFMSKDEILKWLEMI